ncbi:Protein of unknown function DUF1376 [uncultured Caudovirales phage]|uniref:Uncharacterized protein n=1 Tax=uncultured Caudovirales phage TaxID=2100421 RepID=A0A6J5NAX8_9CAUD|nr:Protein of unknown function DUF1376 [uncultured Caudovirales phage]
MAKDPAFLFYPGDYVSGTMGMTFEEKGAYMDLLMLQFNRGHMNTHMIQHTIGHLWEQVKCKFIQDNEGLWYNVRLDIEKDKRKTFTESRRNNIKGKTKPIENESYETHMNNHMKPHMENVNENINIDININKSKCKFDEALEYFNIRLGEEQGKTEAQKFFNYYESNGWKVGKNPMKNWKAAANNWITNSNTYAKGTSNNQRKLTKGEQFNLDAYNLINATTFGAGDYDRILG